MVSSKVQLKIRLFHGPDRIPFDLSDSRNILKNHYMPFHGIISRGLLNMVKEQENIPVNLWNSKAHLLEQGFQDTKIDDEDLLRLVDWAKYCKVLSFAQSAQVAYKYLEKFHSSSFHNTKDLVYDLWNVKEGHTSSVWKVSFYEGGRERSFALNIARDYEAGLELLETSKVMHKIGLEYPDINMAKVRNQRSIPINYNGENISIVVVENKWIEGAHEVHLIKNKTLNEDRYVWVERFLPDPENPAQIGKIRGRYFNQDEVVQIEKDLQNFLNKTATDGQYIQIEINDGDIVWTGENAVIVAIT